VNGKWPFGYEKPISLRRLAHLFNDQGFDLRKSGYHDSLTMAMFRLSYQSKYLRPVRRKTALNRIAETEIVAYFSPHKQQEIPK
jgi:hypothetical protein